MTEDRRAKLLNARRQSFLELQAIAENRIEDLSVQAEKTLREAGARIEEEATRQIRALFEKVLPPMEGAAAELARGSIRLSKQTTEQVSLAIEDAEGSSTRLQRQSKATAEEFSRSLRDSAQRFEARVAKLHKHHWAVAFLWSMTAGVAGAAASMLLWEAVRAGMLNLLGAP